MFRVEYLIKTEYGETKEKKIIFTELQMNSIQEELQTKHKNYTPLITKLEYVEGEIL